MLKFVVIEKKTDIPILEDAIYGHSFRIYNTSLDAWSHLLQKENATDYRVAQVEMQVIGYMGDNE